ncbi:MAG: hypothetical protein ACHQYQ_09040 [Bacteriovoracales bacterium]
MVLRMCPGILKNISNLENLLTQDEIKKIDQEELLVIIFLLWATDC